MINIALCNLIICKRYLLFLVVLFGFSCNAENHITHLNIVSSKSEISVSPRINFQTSNAIKEAIDNGIRINIIAKAELYMDRSLWFNKTLDSKKLILEISYFTLSELYVVKNKTSGDQQAFNNYEQLLQDIDKSIKFIFKQSQEEPLWVKVRVMLDEAALPTAMQLPVLFNQDWDIDTPWFKQKMDNK